MFAGFGEFWSFLVERGPELWLRTGEHLRLTGVSTGLAILIGVPLGILANRIPRIRSPLLSVVSIFQTIPSLAMLAILLAVLSMIGTIPAIIALTLYALLPITRNTLSGLEGVSLDIKEAARGIGMTSKQQLWLVQIPLALPVIVAGIRTAAVIGVGIATLSAFIGAGGLGQFINRGLALANTKLILLGAVPAAILALLVDFSIGAAEWGMSPTRQYERGTFKAKLKPLALAMPFILIGAGIYIAFSPKAHAIRLGTKNFTEQFVLGELMSQMIEDRTDLTVEVLFLGGTTICHRAIVSDEIDMYPEYTGTALTAVLNYGKVVDAEKAFKIVTNAYKKRFDLTWLPQFGYSSPYAIAVRKEDAEEHGWETISDLQRHASRMHAGFTSEFSERPDGYPGLKKVYNLEFQSVSDFEETMMYQAIAEGQVDVISAFLTNAKIEVFNLEPLEDNRNFFPPYDAAAVIRQEVLEKYPQIRDAMAPLFGTLDAETIRQLNYEVDENQRQPAAVAREFLVEQGFITVEEK
jgi:osmoprotectant transport system permease protein